MAPGGDVYQAGHLPRVPATLREAGEARGHAVQVINYLRCTMDISAHKPTVVYQGRPVQGLTARAGTVLLVYAPPA